MTIDQPTIDRIAESTAAKIRNPEDCPYSRDCPCEDPKHQAEHLFVHDAMEVMARLKDLKWNTLKAVMIALVLLLLGFTGTGAAVWFFERIKDVSK